MRTSCRNARPHLRNFVLACVAVVLILAAPGAPVFAQQQSQHAQPGQLPSPTLPRPILHPTQRSEPPMPTASSLEDAARQMALTLADTKAKRVVVLDFAMPQRAEWNRVGQKVAAEFRANLAAAAPNILQLSAEDIAAHMKQYNLAQEDMPIGGVSDFTFEHSGADTWIGAE